MLGRSLKFLSKIKQQLQNTMLSYFVYMQCRHETKEKSCTCRPWMQLSARCRACCWAGALAELRNAQKPKINKNIIKYIPPKIRKMIPFGFSHCFAQGHALLPLTDMEQTSLASNTAPLSINTVAKSGSEALVGSVSGCLGLPGPRQLLPPRRQAGRRQSVANRLFVQAININKAIHNLTECCTCTPKRSFCSLSARVTLSSGHFSSASPRALHK